MNNIQKVVESILSDISLLDDIANLDGNILSEIALRLSVNKVYIGQEVAELEFDLSQTEMSTKTKWGNCFLDNKSKVEKTTVKEAEIAADMFVAEEFMSQLEAKKYVNSLKNLRRDVSDVITTIQTRIGQLKSEMVEIKSISNH